jgi:flagellar biosynthesis/type III secretory pathway protein FliH
MPETNDAVWQLREEVEAHRESILSDPDLSEDAKARKTQELEETARERSREIREARRGEEKEELEDARKRAYGLSYPNQYVAETRKEEYRKEYRDAMFKVSGLEGERLERLYRSALNIGDSVLTQALYHEALNEGHMDLVSEHWNTHPEAKEDYRRYHTLKQEQSDPIRMLIRGFESRAVE